MSTLTIAAVQFEIQWLDKAANFSTLEHILSDFFEHHKAVDLLLLPETFSTGFCVGDAAIKQPEDGGEDLQWLKKIAHTYHCVVAGSVFVEHRDKKANRLYWVSPNGSGDYYDKRHLFRLGNEGDFVSQGQNRKIFTIKGVRILPQVCYDLRFPVWSRNRQDYDLMVNVANWPAARRNVWDTLLKARAMENQVYVVGVNRFGTDGNGVEHSGGTCILDYVGAPIVMAADNQQQVICAEIDLNALQQFKRSFPAYLDADEFELR